MGERAPRGPSIVDGSCRLPSSESVADSVAPPGCSLALVAARVPLAVSGEDAQSGNRLATIPVVPAGVGTVEPSPRCGVRALSSHVGRSDSLAQ